MNSPYWLSATRDLPDWIEQGYVILRDAIDDYDVGIPVDDAIDCLLTHPDFPDELRDAEYALDTLKNHDWTYEVDEHVRVTDPDWPRHLSSATS